MQVPVTKKNVGLAALGITMFLLFVIFAFRKINNRIPYQNALKWEQGWTLRINDSTLNPETLSEMTFQAAPKGDIVVLENVLPNLNFDSYELRLWMCHSAIKVYIDHKEIYDFGWKRYQEDRIVGSGYHWIALDKDSSGKTIRIEFYPVEDNAFTNIPVIYLGEAGDSAKDFISDTFVNICTELFLIMFGIVMIVISICMACMSKQFSTVIYTALFSIVIGLWTLCNRSDIQLISNDFILNQYLEYYSLYLGSLVLLLFMKSIRNQGKRSRILLGLIIANISLVAVTVVLHAFNVVQFPSMLTIYHVFDVVVILYVIVTCIKRIKQGETEERLVVVGISILAACFCFDIIIFNIAKYWNGVLSGLMGITSLGGIAFIICMLSSYAVHIYRGMLSKAERNTLLSMAYTDNLTGTSNVAKFNEVISVYEHKKQAFTMILFDLNSLKKINDSQGHITGDLLIRRFADVLRTSFDKYGTVARIGGDEFAVLLPETDSELMNARMENYEMTLDKVNAEDAKMIIIAAWGIATSTENGGLSGIETKKLADSRMYEKKHKMKDLKLTCR